MNSPEGEVGACQTGLRNDNNPPAGVEGARRGVNRVSEARGARVRACGHCRLTFTRGGRGMGFEQRRDVTCSTS